MMRGKEETVCRLFRHAGELERGIKRLEIGERIGRVYPFAQRRDRLNAGSGRIEVLERVPRAVGASIIIATIHRPKGPLTRLELPHHIALDSGY